MSRIKEIAIVGANLWVAALIAAALGVVSLPEDQPPVKRGNHHGSPITACHCYEE